MEPLTRRGPAPSPRLGGLTAYAVPRHPAPMDLYLDGNEGARPPGDLVVELQALLPDVLRRYPDTGPLAGQVARRLSLRAEQVQITAGADEAIERICRAFLAPGRELILPVPTFEMISRYAALADGTVVPVPWPAGPYPVREVLARRTSATAILAVVSPNNPTGAVATSRDLRELSAAAPEALLLVDLAYGEFAEEDLTPAALALPNAVVTRTFSKAWGMAGLRVGYAAGPEELIARLRSAGCPYPVSGVSLALASAWLARADGAVSTFVSRVRAERRSLDAAIKALGGHALPSQANFILARFRDAEWVRDALAGLGIAIRIFPDRPELAGALRITCPGDAAAMRRLEHALAAACAPEALLLGADAGPACTGLRERTGRGAERRGADTPQRVGGLRLAAVPRPAHGHGSDPGPVLGALESLGATRAWMLAGSVAEVRAARSAGVVPLGMPPPRAGVAEAGAGTAAPPLKEEFLAAGAARVLTTFSDLEDLIP